MVVGLDVMRLIMVVEYDMCIKLPQQVKFFDHNLFLKLGTSCFFFTINNSLVTLIVMGMPIAI